MLATATRASPAAVAANKRRCRFIAGLLRFHSLCNTIARPPPFGMFVLPQDDVGLLTNVNGPTSDLVVSSTNCGPSTAAVFVDEFDAGYFPSRRSPHSHHWPER